MIRIVPASHAALSYIAHNMREADRIELQATSWLDDPAPALPGKVLSFAEMAFVALDDDVPVSAWGLVPLWPGVGSAFAFGTADWGRALWAMTRHVRRFMIPLVLDHGYHRIECRALAGRPDVGRWVALFGARQEAVLRSSGRRGEDFILYRWLSDEHRRPATANTSGHLRAAGDRRRCRGAGDARNGVAQ